AGRNSHHRGNGYRHTAVLQVFQAAPQQVIACCIPSGAVGQPAKGFLDNVHATCFRHGISSLPASTKMPSVAPASPSVRMMPVRISARILRWNPSVNSVPSEGIPNTARSEEHTSELQSRFDLVCRLLLEK